MQCRYVAYYRVSTKSQGDSGLGLEAQRALVEGYAKGMGCRIEAEYTEVESGKRASNRPQLAAAIAHAKRTKATLCIAKLDRLARNVHFVSGLMESKVPFVACDNPHATPFTIHILAAVAEHEAKMISDRTKAALKVAKERGVKLGGKRPGQRPPTEEERAKGRQSGADQMKAAALSVALDVEPLVRQLIEDGLTQTEIASALNERGHLTSAGNPYGQVQVLRLLRRLGLSTKRPDDTCPPNAQDAI